MFCAVLCATPSRLSWLPLQLQQRLHASSIVCQIWFALLYVDMMEYCTTQMES